MSEALDFQGRARRLELTLDGEGRARGRWRRNAVALDASGRLRVSLLAELGEEPAEDGLPPRAPTSIPELGIRSSAPSRLVQILDRPKLRAQVTALLSSVESVEVGDAEVTFQLAGTNDLRGLKLTLDRAVRLAETVRREVDRAPRPPPVVATGEAPSQLEPAMRVQGRERNRRRRRRARRRVAVVAALAAAVVPLWASGHRLGSVSCVFLALVALQFALEGIQSAGVPACPGCGEYLPLFWSRERCPRCDLVLE